MSWRTRPPGILQILRQTADGDPDAALELCRRIEAPDVASLITEYLDPGVLTPDLFDVLCDAFDRSAREHAIDRLDRSITDPPLEGSPT